MPARQKQRLSWSHRFLGLGAPGARVCPRQSRLRGTTGRDRKTTPSLLGWGLLLGTLLSAVLVLGAETASAQKTASAQISVSFPDTSRVASKTDTIPIEVGDLTGEEVFSFEFTVRYDADTLSVTGIETAGTIASGLRAVANTDRAGEVTVSAAATGALSGRGTLVTLEVRSEGAGTSPLVWENFQFNEGHPRADLSGGTVTVDPL